MCGVPPPDSKPLHPGLVVLFWLLFIILLVAVVILAVWGLPWIAYFFCKIISALPHPPAI
jgi:hypothetical protein